MTVWNIFEIIGTIAFAISGALIGIEKKLDIFGVIMLSVTTAVGGGIIRDTLIGNTPPLSFRDPSLTVISIIAAIAVCIAYNKMNKYKNTIQFFDAIGLGAFTATGASLAIQHNLNTLYIMIVLGLATGVGGGVLRDIFAQEIPYVFKKEVYAVASIIGATAFYYSQPYMDGSLPLYFCFALTAGIRLFCIRLNINLPRINVGKHLKLTNSQGQARS